MHRRTDLTILNDIRVAAPCHEDWGAMTGNERVRFCQRCAHKVYNLSDMSAADAAKLVRESEGRLCVRLYRRPDGTLLTRDCPTGLRAVRRRVAKKVALAGTALACLLGYFQMGKPREQQSAGIRWLLSRLDPEPAPPPHFPEIHVMGSVGMRIPETEVTMGVMAAPVAPPADARPDPFVDSLPDPK